MADKDFKGFKKDNDTYNCYDPTARSGVNSLTPRVGIAEGKITTLQEQMLSVQNSLDNLGTASIKNSTSVVTDSSDLVESGAVYNAIQEFTKKVSNNEVYGLRQAKGNMVDFDLVGGSLVWNQFAPFVSVNDYATYQGSVIYNNGVATFTGTSSVSGLFQTDTKRKKGVLNHKYLVSATVKLTTATDKVYVTARRDNAVFASKYSNANTDWQTLSAIGVYPDSVDAKIYPAVYDSRTSGWDAIQIKEFMLIDLTQLFGSTIADYIYSLEQATAGAGVEWFRQYFPNDYYAYSAGAIQSVNVASRKVVGKNLLTPSATTANNTDYKVFGGILNNNNADGTLKLPKGIYTISASIQMTSITVSDKNSTVIVFEPNTSALILTLTKTTAIKISFNKSNANWNDIKFQIEIGTEATDYEPYTETTYPFDSTKQLRGIPKLVDNKLNYDGDIYTADGSVTRKYGIVDLGSLDWTVADGVMRTSVSGIKMASATNAKANVICAKYETDTSSNVNLKINNKTIAVHTINNQVWIYDSSYTDAAAFKTAMNGVYLVYELETPTTETAQSYQNPQRAYIDGIEEMVDAGVSADTRDVAIPVGNNSVYYLSDTLPPIEDYVDGTAKILEAEILTKADTSVIAPTENGATVQKSDGYAVGSHAIRNGKFITWKVAKAQGETINDASDYTAGDVADCLDVLEYDFTTSQTFSNDYKNKLTKVGNIVYLSANFTGVTESAFAPLLSIPSGLRPSKQFAFTLFISGTAKRGIVYSDGNVTSTEAISNAAINIETSWVI